MPRTCAFDYQQAADAWSALLAAHEGDGSSGGKIEVIYEDGGDWADIEQLFRDTQFLENAAASVDQRYVLPRDLQMTAKVCDEENAHYSYDEGGITFCYEMFGLFFRLIEDELLNPAAQ